MTRKQTRLASEGRAASKKQPAGRTVTYAAFAVSEDGSRNRIDAKKLVVDVGDGTEIEIALFELYSAQAQRLCITSRRKLGVHPGAANMFYVSVQPGKPLAESPL